MKAIAAGRTEACAVTRTGGVACWGENRYSALGDGTSVRRLSPVVVSGLPAPAVAVSAGTWHTCALLVDGRAMCWGHGNYGELGYGGTSNRTAPVTVRVEPG